MVNHYPHYWKICQCPMVSPIFSMILRTVQASCPPAIFPGWPHEEPGLRPVMTPQVPLKLRNWGFINTYIYNMSMYIILLNIVALGFSMNIVYQ